MFNRTEILTVWQFHQYLRRTTSDEVFGKTYTYKFDNDIGIHSICNDDWEYAYWLTRTKPEAWEGEGVEIRSRTGIVYPRKIHFLGDEEIFRRDISMIRMLID